MPLVEALGAIVHAPINVAASGDTTIVAAVGEKTIRVLSIALVAAGSVVATFKSSETAITGPLPLATGQPLAIATGWGCFQTAPGEALALNLSGSVQVSGWIAYQAIV